MIDKLEPSSGKIIGFALSGKLHDEDYKSFVPEIEAVIQREGKARVLAYFHEFHGWDLHAVWDDMKFAAKHYKDLERVALVGDRKWEEWMAKICRPFTIAEIRYFEDEEMDKAWDWLRDES